MAKKEHTFDEICKNIKAKKFDPIYLLFGEEPFFIDKITELLIDNVLNETEKDFNQTILYGADTDVGTIFNAARRFPMMSEYQLVIVREAQEIRNIDILANYVKNPLKSTILVINYKYKPLNGHKSLSVYADKIGTLFESKKIPDYKMPTFIEKSLKEKNITADEKSIQMLADFLGNDLNRLHKELDKLSILFTQTNKNNITPEIIEQNIGISKEYNNFELIKAISTKDILKANRIIQYFEKTPENTIQSTLSILFNYFSNLLICHYSNNKTTKGIMATLELKFEIQAKDYTTGLNNFSAMKAYKLISEIRNADAHSKGYENTSQTQGDLMKELLYKILH